MKCPLHTWFFEDEGKDAAPGNGACLQGECAWWSFDHDRCAICVIALELVKLCKNVANVANLMPRGGVR